MGLTIHRLHYYTFQESRHQNYSLVSICDTLASCKDSLVMTETTGWMDLDHVPIFTKDGRQFAMILSSEGYKHVNVINRDVTKCLDSIFGSALDKKPS